MNQLAEGSAYVEGLTLYLY